MPPDPREVRLSRVNRNLGLSGLALPEPASADARFIATDDGRFALTGPGGETVTDQDGEPIIVTECQLAAMDRAIDARRAADRQARAEAGTPDDDDRGFLNRQLGGLLGLDARQTEQVLDATQLALDALGLTPVVGIAFDVPNIIISLLRGNFGDALASTGAAIPVLGQVAGGAKLAANAGDLAKTAGDSASAMKAAPQSGPAAPGPTAPRRGDALSTRGEAPGSPDTTPISTPRTATGDDAKSLAERRRIQLQRNKAQGQAFEEIHEAILEKSDLPVVEKQVTVELKSGRRTRVDLMAQTKDGRTICVECKSSPDAPLSSSQSAANSELPVSGGIVRSKTKKGFRPGHKIDPTELQIIRPGDKIDIE